MVPNALAEELIISGNGADSVSTITYTPTETTNVTQQNSSTITNNIVVNSNTGDNTADANTGGETQILTGDTTTNLDIQNISNQSVAEVNNCCPTDETNETIVQSSGNGASSTNNINIVSNTSTNVNVLQNAFINNNVAVSANTGKNEANSNSGEVTIKTGNIFVNSTIQNAINISNIKVLSGSENFITALINENGSFSNNNINLSFDKDINPSITSIAKITNNTLWDLNTGRNSANRNGGNVNIETGDVFLEVLIKNIANIGGVEISDCCELPEPPEEEKPAVNPEVANAEVQGQIVSGVSTSAVGGPEIFGLSDTASRAVNTFLFWVGLVIFILGVKYLSEGLASSRLRFVKAVK